MVWGEHVHRTMNDKALKGNDENVLDIAGPGWYWLWI